MSRVLRCNEKKCIDTWNMLTKSEANDISEGAEPTKYFHCDGIKCHVIFSPFTDKTCSNCGLKLCFTCQRYLRCISLYYGEYKCDGCRDDITDSE